MAEIVIPPALVLSPEDAAWCDEDPVPCQHYRECQGGDARIERLVAHSHWGEEWVPVCDPCYQDGRDMYLHHRPLRREAYP